MMSITARVALVAWVVEVLFVVTCGLGKMVGKEVGGEEG
jgi:hypothetical protein